MTEREKIQGYFKNLLLLLILLDSLLEEEKKTHLLSPHSTLRHTRGTFSFVVREKRKKQIESDGIIKKYNELFGCRTSPQTE